MLRCAYLCVSRILSTFKLTGTCQFVFCFSSCWISWMLFLTCEILYESGALQDVLHLHDVLARVSLARLCHTISRARALDGMIDFMFSDFQMYSSF